MRRRKFTLLLIACYLIGMLVLPVYAAPTEGTYGDNIRWHFDAATGTLTISGTGVATGISESSGEAYDPYRLEIRHIVIENGFTEIATSAFRHFFYLESISIGDTVKIIGDRAFLMNNNVKCLNLGTGVTTIGESAFDAMGKLEELVLPSSVQNIGVEAFSLCGISELTIPDGVTVIKEGAFRANENLTRITIPVSVTEIKYAAFRDCNNLTDVYYAGTQAQWEAINIDDTVDGQGGSNSALFSATIHYNHTHSWDGGKVSVAAGCEKAGERTYTCTGCGAKKTEPIPKLAQHTWDGGTRNADTTVTYHCTTCTAEKTEGTPVTNQGGTGNQPTEPTTGQGDAGNQETQPSVEQETGTTPTEETMATEETLPPEENSMENNTPTKPVVGNNTQNPVDPAKKFPWPAVCVGIAVLLAGGGAAIWFCLRKRRGSAS